VSGNLVRTPSGEQKKTMTLTPAREKNNYREEAQYIRGMAEKLQDIEVRSQLLMIASLYDKLADHQQRTATQKSATDTPAAHDAQE